MLFPIDRMRNVNRGRLELRTFDPETGFRRGRRGRGRASRAGKDPFAGRTGDFKRHYLLDAGQRNHAVPDVRADGVHRRARRFR